MLAAEHGRGVDLSGGLLTQEQDLEDEVVAPQEQGAEDEH
jgi:hypothetical protein